MADLIVTVVLLWPIYFALAHQLCCALIMRRAHDFGNGPTNFPGAAALSSLPALSHEKHRAVSSTAILHLSVDAFISVVLKSLARTKLPTRPCRLSLALLCSSYTSFWPCPCSA